jgi:hypothetical protein
LTASGASERSSTPTNYRTEYRVLSPPIVESACEIFDFSPSAAEDGSLTARIDRGSDPLLLPDR